MLIVCLMAISCGDSRGHAADGADVKMKKNPAGTTAVSDSMKTEMALQLEREVIRDRVRTIYRMVKQENVTLGGSVDNDLLDKQFCSKSWNKLLMAVRIKEHNTNSLFFEVNHWTMLYDTDLVDFDEFEVKNNSMMELGGVRTATVNFTVYTAHTYTPARIDLVYENGEWKIDNFYNLKYMLNMRASMWQYLGNDMMSYFI